MWKGTVTSREGDGGIKGTFKGGGVETSSVGGEGQRRS